jgi:hypothetical protein
MTDELETEVGVPGRAGDRRGADRRRADRRRDDRRAPVHLWRRPAAFVAYGVVGALFLVLILRGLGGPVEDPGPDGAGDRRQAEAFPPASLPVSGPTREAFTVAQYERLLAEGDAAAGEIVRTELFCGSLSPTSIRETERTYPALLQLADSEARVAAAECRWSAQARTSDFLLVVPPDLAEEFARAPEVELNFVRRRRINAHVEWIGRSDALALRNAGVLREILPR